MWCSNDNDDERNAVKSMLLFVLLEVLYLPGGEEFLGIFDSRIKEGGCI